MSGLPLQAPESCVVCHEDIDPSARGSARTLACTLCLSHVFVCTKCAVKRAALIPTAPRCYRCVARDT
jgi:hypothetical protein